MGEQRPLEVGREGRAATWLMLLPLVPPLAVFAAGAGLSVAQSFGLAVPVPAPPGWPALAAGRWWAMFAFSAWVALASAGLSTLLGALLAWGVWRLPATLARLAVVYKIPLILPHLCVAFIILVLLAGSGLPASICARLGLIAAPQDFPDILFSGWGLGMIAAYAYKETAFALLLCLAALRRLDPRQVQVARMFGATRLLTLRRVVWPHLAPAAGAVFIILFLYSFGAFDIPYLVGESAPGMAGVKIWELYFLGDLADRPLAMALAVSVLVFCLVCVAVYARVAAGLSGRERKL